MNSFTIFAFLAVVLTVVSVVVAAPHPSNDHPLKVNHEQIRLKAMRSIMNKLRKSSPKLRSGTTEVDLRELKLAMDDAFVNCGTAFVETSDNILALLAREGDEETKNLYSQALDLCAEDVTYYYYYFVLYAGGLIDDEEVPALAEATVQDIQDSFAGLVVTSEIIIENGAKEILDQVKAIDLKLLEDIKTAVKPVLDILKSGKQ